MHETICIRGGRTHVEALAAAIRESQIEGIEVSVPLPSEGNLLSRAPLGQFGLFEVLISIAGSMVSSAAYDSIKLLIAGFSKDGKVEVVTSLPQPRHKTKSKSEEGSTKHKPGKSGAPKKGQKK